MSLLPSATEIVYALGLGGDLVGVTFECDEPPSARTEKEVVVAGRDTSGMTPAEIEKLGVLRNPVISWREAHGAEPPSADSWV